MIRRKTIEASTAAKNDQRPKSEVPKFFQDSISKVTNSKNFSSVYADPNSYTKRADPMLVKHREIILTLVKHCTDLNETILSKLKEITVYPDILTDFIYKLIREEVVKASASSQYIEEISDYQKYTRNLQMQLLRERKYNQELKNMLLSRDVQDKLDKDLNQSIQVLSNSYVARPKSVNKRKVIVRQKLDYDRIIKAAQTGRDEEGLKTLCEEVRRGLLADFVSVFKPNSQLTYFSGLVNGVLVRIPAKSTIFSVVYHTEIGISAKIGDQNFDSRIQESLKMKVKAFQAGLILDHLNKKQGILLIIRKIPELLFEREIPNILNIFSLYSSRWKLWEDYQDETNKVEQIIYTCSELLNTVTLHQFIYSLQNKLSKIFKCERGNVLLFDYEKNNLFRKNEEKYENFPIFHGLSGNSVNTKRTVICNDVSIERMFCKEMDDPYGSDTKSIISVPLFSKTLENVPEGVIQLINKQDESYFNEKDGIEITKFAKMITDCMIVLKFSQLSASLIDVLKKLENSLQKMSEDMNLRVYDFEAVVGSIGVLKSFFLKFYN